MALAQHQLKIKLYFLAYDFDLLHPVPVQLSAKADLARLEKLEGLVDDTREQLGKSHSKQVGTWCMPRPSSHPNVPVF